jgi:hypothetical protein
VVAAPGSEHGPRRFPVRPASSALGIPLARTIGGGQPMAERNPRNDENMDDRIDENIDDRTNEENLVDKSEDAEEFEDIEESDDEDVEEE